MAKVQVILCVVAFAVCQVSGQRGRYPYNTYQQPGASTGGVTFVPSGTQPGQQTVGQTTAGQQGGVVFVPTGAQPGQHTGTVSRPTGQTTAGQQGGVVFVPTGTQPGQQTVRPTGTTTGQQTGGTVLVPTGTQTVQQPGGVVFRPNTPVVGGTTVYTPYPARPNNYIPVPTTTYQGAERLPQIQEVHSVVATAKATEEAVVPTTLSAAATAGQGISTTFEKMKQESQVALTAVNPAQAQDIMGRITSTVDNGRHSVNTALSNVQYNPEGALNDARQAAAITLAEVERTLRANNVPEDVANALMEKTKVQVNSVIDSAVASVAAAEAANVAAKAAVKTTTVAKITEVTTSADAQIADHLTVISQQTKGVVSDPAKQKEIDDMLSRARNDIAANLVIAKNNPSAAIQPARATAHHTLNEIARMLRNEGVDEVQINQIIEGNRTQIINILNETENKVSQSVYQASIVGIRV